MIPKNTLVRNKVKKILREEGQGQENLIKKMSMDTLTGNYHVKRRVNQMIKKRVTSMLTGDAVDIEEVGDLLELLEFRLLMDGYDLEDAKNEKNKQKEKYGGYEKLYTTTDSYAETESDIFIDYNKIGHAITDGDHIRNIDRLYNDKGF